MENAADLAARHGLKQARAVNVVSVMDLPNAASAVPATAAVVRATAVEEGGRTGFGITTPWQTASCLWASMRITPTSNPPANITTTASPPACSSHFRPPTSTPITTMTITPTTATPPR